MTAAEECRFKMENNLKGKTALVTGASAGIGKATAIAMAQDGAKVICASRNLENCQAVAKEITDMGLLADAYSVDVSKPEDVKVFAAEVLKKHERVDILVNNAGTAIAKMFLVTKIEDWNWIMETNLTSCFTVTSAFIRPMLMNGWGRIINISSLSGLIGNPGQVCYSAAKSGIVGFTKTLARDFQSNFITVNTVAPGFIDTPLVRTKLTESTIEYIRSVTPLRKLGVPEDVANLCLFLSQDDASYINGQVIKIDGGLAQQYFE